jgi:hypothetical protein
VKQSCIAANNGQVTNYAHTRQRKDFRTGWSYPRLEGDICGGIQICWRLAALDEVIPVFTKYEIEHNRVFVIPDSL